MSHAPSADSTQSIIYNSSSNLTDISAPLRHSNQQRHPPSYLKHYQCHISTVNTVPTWCQSVTYDHFRTTQKTLLSSICIITKKNFYKEVIAHPLWVEATDKEIKALNDDKTWNLVPLLPNKKVLGCKWVYKVRLKANGSLERCKTRLVAMGFNQKY